MEDVVIDTNVFVAAGFNPQSASARILEGIREARFRLIWNEPTRRETETTCGGSHGSIGRASPISSGQKRNLLGLLIRRRSLRSQIPTTGNSRR